MGNDKDTNTDICHDDGNNSSNSDGYMWEDLMGQDLRLRMDPQHENENDECCIEVGDIVTFDWTGYSLCDDGQATLFCREVNWMITVGSGEVEPALEMGIRFMNGIKRLGTIEAHSKYCYGRSGLMKKEKKAVALNEDQRIDDKNSTYLVPPECYVRYEVMVLDVRKASSLSSTSDDVDEINQFWLKYGLAKKRTGNFYFGFAQAANENAQAYYSKAGKLYSDCAEMVQGVLKQQCEQEQKLEGKVESAASVHVSSHDVDTRNGFTKKLLQLVIDCLNNAAMVNIKLGNFQKAIDVCAEVIDKYDHENMKALCRAAQAACLKDSFEEAEVAIKVALSIDVGTGRPHPDAQRMERFYLKTKRAFKTKQKELYSKMGSSFSAITAAEKDAGVSVGEVVVDSDRSLFEKINTPLHFSFGVLASILVFAFSTWHNWTK